jgi:hypothetical protein
MSGDMNESHEPSPDSTPAPSPVPRAKPLLKSYQLAFLLASGTAFLFWASPGQFMRIAEPLVWPVYYLVSHLPWGRGDSTLGYVVALALALVYLFGLWLVIVWGWRRSSRGFKLALAGCALASVGCYWGLNAYRERIDWTSRGLNPARPGFKPAVVLLAGTFDYRFTGWETGKPYSGTARFEIRMRGADYYYAERWTGHQGKYGSWDALRLSLPDFSGTWNRSYSGSGRHGRGGSSAASDETLLAARRLWNGPEFIGASAADEYSIGRATERFSKLKQHGRFQIPERIEWTEGDRREVLHVRRVEFLHEPSTGWFRMIKQKYFDRGDGSRQFWKTNLNEAGWAGEKKP